MVDGVSSSVDMNLSKLRETVKERGAGCAAARGVGKRQTRLRDCTATSILCRRELTFLIYSNLIT